MEVIIVLLYHLFILGAITFIVTGLLGFLFPRLHILFLLLLSMVLGFIYDFFLFEGAPIFLMIYNSIVALSSIGLVKVCLYAKKKADRLVISEE